MEKERGGEKMYIHGNTSFLKKKRRCRNKIYCVNIEGNSD